MQQYELNLRDYWFVIQKRRWVIIVVFLAIFITTAIYTATQKAVYRATAVVLWQERKSLGTVLTEVLTAKGSITGRDPLEAQAKIITSGRVLKNAVVELGLISKDATEAQIMQQVRAIRGGVSADLVPETNLIRINVTHRDPQMAANISNKVAESYIIDNVNLKSKRTRDLREFIEKRLEEVSDKLKTSEDTLAKYKETELSSDLTLSLQNRLDELEKRRQDLLQIYTESHPDIENIDIDIKEIKAKLEALPQKQLGYSRLTREVEINSKLYRDLKEKLESARIAEADKEAEVTLIETASPIPFPVSPNKRLNYILGITLGLALGLTFAFITEQLDTSISTVEEVEAYIGSPILGVIPCSQIKKKEGSLFKRFISDMVDKESLEKTRQRLIISPEVESSIVEAYRMLDTNIGLAFEAKAVPKAMLISSTAPGEGKTLISCNLAITIAKRGGRVLLIDADLRRPMVHQLFGLEKEPGLSEVLSGSHKIRDVLKSPKERLDNLNFITSGHLPDNPLGLLSSEKLTDLLAELRNSFDTIIFDSPPVLPVGDVSILSQKAEAVVLVYQVGKVSRVALLRAKKQLESAGAKLKGLVLNCLNPQMELNKVYYYYRKYYTKDKAA
jgi:polysaccharide biosynthesis transport protein